MKTLIRQLLPLAAVIAGVFLLGTLGYMALEGWPLLDALYMTVITLTTIGFGETRPLDAAGRIFTIGLIVVGFGVVAYGLTAVTEIVLTANLGAQLRRRRMLRELSKVKDHIIVCGFGRVGWTAATSLRGSLRTVVVVDQDPALVARARDGGFLVLEGDATRDEVLREAGIDRAWGFMAATGRDADNLLMVLSARALNGGLFIVARSTVPDNEPKMIRAGANRVVSPYHMGGRHMANLMVRPHITEFLDVVTLESGVELWLEELVIADAADLAGKTVIESDLRRRTGVNLVALRKGQTGSLKVAGEDTLLEAGDELIVLGTREQLTALASLAGPQDVRDVLGHRVGDSA